MKYKLVNYFAGDNGNINCSLCGTPHNHQYWLEDENGNEIEVGSECARKLLQIPLGELRKLAEEILNEKTIKNLNTIHIQFLNESETKLGIQGKLFLVEKKAKELELEGWEEIDRGSVNLGNTMFLTMKRDKSFHRQ